MQIVILKFPENLSKWSYVQILFCHLDVKHNNLCYVVEGLREGILNLKFKEMSLDI